MESVLYVPTGSNFFITCFISLILSFSNIFFVLLITKCDSLCVCQIGKLQEGLNPPSWNMLRFHGSHLSLVIKTGLITGILSLTVKFHFSFSINVVCLGFCVAHILRFQKERKGFILIKYYWTFSNRKVLQQEGLLHLSRTIKLMEIRR